MSSKFVRASKFRHVFGEPVKAELQYSDLELSPVTGDHNYIKGNSKFFAVAVRGGGGPVAVIPYTQTGKLPRGYPTLNGHSAAVYDTAWNPFCDNILATGSDDTTVKIWSVPDSGLTETMRDASATLSGHGKPVSLLNWHPTANNVLASAGKDPCVKIWDVEAGVAKNTIEGFAALIQDFNFNHDGSLLITSTKDKVARIVDPRTGGAVSDWVPHEGGKAFKTLFLGDRHQILTVGFTKQSKREFKVWDMDRLAEPIATQEIDQQAGVMMPFYDDDTRVLYLTGKGDGNIRYYEFVDEAPFVYYLAEHRTNVSTKGADMLPKRACNVLKCEVARFLKLTADSVEPISFIVPRKSEAFQEDIFPDCYAGRASLSASEWFSGKNAAPVRMSLDPARSGTFSTPAVSAGSGSVAPKPVVASSTTTTAGGGGGASAATSGGASSGAGHHIAAGSADSHSSSATASSATASSGAAAVASKVTHPVVASGGSIHTSGASSGSHTASGAADSSSNNATSGGSASVDPKAFAALENLVRSLESELHSVKTRLAALEAAGSSTSATGSE